MKTFVISVLTVAVAASSLAGAAFAAKKAGAGKCGENMYYSAKAKKCVDARTKAG